MPLKCILTPRCLTIHLTVVFGLAAQLPKIFPNLDSFERPLFSQPGLFVFLSLKFFSCVLLTSILCGEAFFELEPFFDSPTHRLGIHLGHPQNLLRIFETLFWTSAINLRNKRIIRFSDSLIPIKVETDGRLDLIWPFLKLHRSTWISGVLEFFPIWRLNIVTGYSGRYKLLQWDICKPRNLDQCGNWSNTLSRFIPNIRSIFNFQHFCYLRMCAFQFFPNSL